MSIPLKQFTWKGQPLGPVPGDLNEVRNSLEVTTWVVDQLRQCGYREVSRLLRKNQVRCYSLLLLLLSSTALLKEINKPSFHQRVVRLFKLKTMSIDGETCPVPWTIRNSWSALAIALYIFGKQTNIEDCVSCQNKNSRGPGRYCISGGPDVVKGACYNCYYSGRGQNCSIRSRKYLTSIIRFL